LTALGLAGLSGNMASGYLAGVTILVIDAFISALLILTTVFVSYAVDSEDLSQMGGFRSKLAHRGMEVAVFAMISIPPFSGFWLCNWVQTLALKVADGILANGNLILIYSGYGLFTLLILTGAVTAFYGLRVMGLIFSEASHKRKTRSVPSSMRASLTIFLGLTIILDLTVPFFIPLLNSFFLPIVQVQVFGNALDVLVYIIPSMSTVLTVIALIIGGLISRQIYIKRKIDPSEIMRKHSFLEKGHKVLFNGFYIDSLYRTIANSVISFSKKLYRGVEMEGIKRPKIKGIGEFFNIVVNWIGSFSRRVYPLMEPGFFEGFNRKLGAGVIKLSQWIYSSVELEGFEEVNQKLSGGTAKVANKLRRIQTGILSYNIFLMLIGVVLLAVMLLKFGGYLGA
jgi:NADH:ubiquinone oxidoreductase subunit 5 (subunit L)/multisubunit Na+/H+ antiporter MnhA subunit